MGLENQDQGSQKKDMARTYVVALRAPSAARFENNGHLQILKFPTPLGPVDLTYRTRHSQEGFSVPIPRELWIDVQGPASSLKEAIQIFAYAAHALTPVVAFAANAGVGE